MKALFLRIILGLWVVGCCVVYLSSVSHELYSGLAGMLCCVSAMLGYGVAGIISYKKIGERRSELRE